MLRKWPIISCWRYLVSRGRVSQVDPICGTILLGPVCVMILLDNGALRSCKSRMLRTYRWFCVVYPVEARPALLVHSIGVSQLGCQGAHRCEAPLELLNQVSI